MLPFVSPNISQDAVCNVSNTYKSILKIIILCEKGHFLSNFNNGSRKKYYSDISFGFTRVEHTLLAFFHPNMNTRNSITQKPPPIYPSRPFLAVFRVFLTKMYQKKLFSQHLLTKILESVVWPIKCAHLKHHIHTTSTSLEILFFIPLAHKPNLENLTFIFIFF